MSLAALLLPHIQAVHFTTFDEDPRAEALHEHARFLFESQRINLHSSYDHFIGLLAQEQLIAVAALAIYDDEKLTVEVSFATDPAYHRKGLARYLLQLSVKQAQELARDLDYDAVTVEAYIVNDVMHTLLASEGFVMGDGPIRYRTFES